MNFAFSRSWGILFAWRGKADASAGDSGNQQEDAEIYAGRNGNPVRRFENQGAEVAQPDTEGDGEKAPLFAPAFISLDRLPASGTRGCVAGHLSAACRTLFQISHVFLLYCTGSVLIFSGKYAASNLRHLAFSYSFLLFFLKYSMTITKISVT